MLSKIFHIIDEPVSPEIKKRMIFELIKPKVTDDNYVYYKKHLGLTTFKKECEFIKFFITPDKSIENIALHIYNKKSTKEKFELLPQLETYITKDNYLKLNYDLFKCDYIRCLPASMIKNGNILLDGREYYGHVIPRKEGIYLLTIFLDYNKIPYGKSNEFKFGDTKIMFIKYKNNFIEIFLNNKIYTIKYYALL